MNGNIALTNILSGNVTPSWKLPMIPLSIKDVPTSYLTNTNCKQIGYEVFVGYWYYSTFHIPVKYEFGF